MGDAGGSGSDLRGVPRLSIVPGHGDQRCGLRRSRGGRGRGWTLSTAPRRIVPSLLGASGPLLRCSPLLSRRLRTARLGALFCRAASGPPAWAALAACLSRLDSPRCSWHRVVVAPRRRPESPSDTGHPSQGRGTQSPSGGAANSTPSIFAFWQVFRTKTTSRKGTSGCASTITGAFRPRLRYSS